MCSLFNIEVESQCLVVVLSKTTVADRQRLVNNSIHTCAI